MAGTVASPRFLYDALGGAEFETDPKYNTVVSYQDLPPENLGESYGQYIRLPRGLRGNPVIDEVLAHERVHADQYGKMGLAGPLVRGAEEFLYPYGEGPMESRAFEQAPEMQQAPPRGVSTINQLMAAYGNTLGKGSRFIQDFFGSN